MNKRSEIVLARREENEPAIVQATPPTAIVTKGRVDPSAWSSAQHGAGLVALECFASGDVEAGRYHLECRARYRDNQLTFAELHAAVQR